MSTAPLHPSTLDAPKALPRAVAAAAPAAAPVPTPAPEHDLAIETSPTIGALAGALAKAQGMMTGAGKDAKGLVGKVGQQRQYGYATLASVWEAIRAPLSANGLAAIQTTEPHGKEAVCVVTTLAHESGEWMRGRLYMPVALVYDERGGRYFATTQGFGSAITYARRYALMAIAGIAPEDDDGAAAQSASQAGSQTPRASVVHRDVKPDNISRPAAPPAADGVRPASPADAMTVKEARAVAELGPKLTQATTEKEVEAIRRQLVLAADGKRPSSRYWAWYQESLKQAYAAIGVTKTGGPS